MELEAGQSRIASKSCAVVVTSCKIPRDPRSCRILHHFLELRPSLGCICCVTLLALYRLPVQDCAAMQTSSTNSDSDGQSTAAAKILADLNVLKEKMELCDTMLNPGDGSPAPSLKDNETLLAVIGFLEACAPRMVELVEAAAQGSLSENVLMDALQVNDQLQKLLGDIDTYAFTETPAATTAASAPEPSIEDALDDLLLDDGPSVAGTNSAHEDDPFGVLQSTAAAGGKTAGEEEGEDPFATSQPTSAGAKTTGEEEEEDPFASLHSSSAGAKTTGEEEDPFANLQPTSVGAKTTGEAEDPFANETLTPTPMDSKPSAAAPL